MSNMRSRITVRFFVSVIVASGLTAVGSFASDAATESSTASVGPPQKHATPTRLPDWSGVWTIPEPVFVEAIMAETDPKNPRAPKLSPDNLKKLEAYNIHRFTGQDPPGIPPQRTNTELCLPPGMPAVMRDPTATEYLFTPGRVTIISESGPTVRRIFTDPKLRPQDTDELTFSGTSVGHWEGQTLVVETSGISPRAQLLATVGTSGKAHVTERIMLKDPTHLQIDTVVTDPVALKTPWHYTRIYNRSPTNMRDDVCLENNRDPNGGEPDLTPPK
jgi:hypothetical protein